MQTIPLFPLQLLNPHSEGDGCAIIVVNHLNKMFGTKAIYRTPGSIDIVGAVKSALLIGRSKDNEDERILVQQKANLARDGFGHRVLAG